MTRHIIVALISLLLYTTAFSETPKSALDKSSKFFNSLKNFSLAFEVTTLYDITEEKKTYTGTLIVGQKDKFALDHSEINMVSDGVVLWEHRKAHNQVLIKSLLDLESGFHSSEILFKYLKCKPLTVTEKKEKGNKYFVLTLDPTKHITYLKNMEVWLNGSDYSPYKIKTIDVSDNTSWYTINDFKGNQDIPEATFTFVPKKNTEIIDMR